MSNLKSANLSITEVQIWPVRDPEGPRIKAMATITFNNTLRVNGLRIIEGIKGLFLSFPSQKKPGSDQYFPLFYPISRSTADEIQDKVIERYKDMVA